MRICLGILTTGTRQETLDLCVQSISNLVIPENVNFEVLIVENLKAYSEVVSKIISESRIDVINKVLEPRRGIPFARNKALDFAIDNKIDFLGFVDDDAIVDELWLVNLVKRIGEAQAVTGPQIPIFPSETSKLFSDATVYKERSLKDGEVCKWAATNNVLFDVEFANNNAIRFSEDMKTGGSDKEFFSRYSKLGARIVWVEEAVVREYVESDRINFIWAIKRTFRFGGTGYRIERCTKSRVMSVVTCVFKSSFYLVRGLTSLLVYPFCKDKSILDGFCDIAHGVAFVFSIFSGGKLKEYT
jgi:glycosyltransferase involved in cell wall biosynthesis